MTRFPRIVSVPVKLWRGEYGLAATFWLWGVCGEVAVGLLSVAINVVAVPGPLAMVVVGPLLFLFGTLVFLYRFVVTVGIVHAATTYKRHVAAPIAAVVLVIVWWHWSLFPIPSP